MPALFKTEKLPGEAAGPHPRRGLLGLLDGRRAGDRLGLAPELRLGLAVTASLAALIAGDPLALGLMLAASLLYLAAQVRPRVILAAYLALAVLAGLAAGCLWLMGFVFQALRNISLDAAVNPFLRLGLSVNLLLPLALHSRLTDLSGILNRLRLPGLIKLPLLVTIRFIPTFLNDLNQIREAVGLRFRGRGGLLFWARRPLLGWRVCFTPLVVRLIRSADELAVAAELKGLSAESDFGHRPPRLRPVDQAVAVLAALTLAGAALLEILHAAA
ncbi:MAG: energy-coupling factor transporter transmembrane protein EcfT [Candidatus Adiutrix sp.]|jgi:energy-coupling factor transport system permease protein|nr:energy-coupling factor transporter transmembrane protein EcfT [Candidatus Adiutrix sp.]